MLCLLNYLLKKLKISNLDLIKSGLIIYRFLNLFWFWPPGWNANHFCSVISMITSLADWYHTLLITSLKMECKCWQLFFKPTIKPGFTNIHSSFFIPVLKSKSLFQLHPFASLVLWWIIRDSQPCVFHHIKRLKNCCPLWMVCYVATFLSPPPVVLTYCGCHVCIGPRQRAADEKGPVWTRAGSVSSLGNNPFAAMDTSDPTTVVHYPALSAPWTSLTTKEPDLWMWARGRGGGKTTHISAL